MPHVSTNDGVRLHVEETGQGLPVLFVHEFAGDHRSWEPQVRALSRRYRCITYAARGYPPSDVPEDPAAYSQARANRSPTALPIEPPRNEKFITAMGSTSEAAFVCWTGRPGDGKVAAEAPPPGDGGPA